MTPTRDARSLFPRSTGAAGAGRPGRSRVLAVAALAAAVVALAGCAPKTDELVEAARGHIAKREFEPAKGHLKNVLKAKPDHAEARVLLGRVLADTNDPAGAEAEYRRALEAGASEDTVLPLLATAMVAQDKGSLLVQQYGTTVLKDASADAELKTQLAIALVRDKAADRAELLMAEAMRRAPDHVPAAAMAARLRADRGDIDGALAQIEQMLQRKPDAAGAWAVKGDLLLAKGRADDAMAAWRQSLKLQPNQATVHVALLSELFGRKDITGAEAQAAEMKKALPQHPQTKFYEALLAASKGDYARARETLQPLLARAPDNPRLLMLAGEVEMKLDNLAQAEAHFSRVVNGAPKLAAARRMLAQVQLKARQPDKVLTTLEPLLAASPPDTVALTLAGQARVMLGDAKGAETAFAKAADLSPGDPRARAAQALTRLGQGDDKALGDLETLAAKDKGVRVDVVLIGSLLRRGDIAGAKKQVEKLVAKQPDTALPHHLRGRVALLERDKAAARKHYEVALSKDADFLPSMAGLAELDLVERQYDAARGRFEALLKRQPKNANAMLALSDIVWRAGDAAKSQEWAEAAVKAAPAQPLPRLVLVENLQRQGKAEAALTAAQAGVAALPGNAELMQRQGLLEMSLGQAEAAQSTFAKLVQQNKRSPGALLLLADAQRAAGNQAGATLSLRKARELGPEEPEVLEAVAVQAMRDGKPDEATTLARRLQAKTPKEATGFVLEGDIAAAQKRWDEAANAYRRALALVPFSGSTAVRVHQSLLRGGKTADAERFAGDWLTNHASDAVMPLHLADLAQAAGKSAEAEQMYRQLLQRHPNNALALNNLAYLLAVQKKKGAVELAKKALAVSPNQPAFLDTLALSQAAEGDIAQAVKTQTDVVRMSPNAPQFRLQLAKLHLEAGDRKAARDELRVLAKLGDKFPQHQEVADLLKPLGG